MNPAALQQLPSLPPAPAGFSSRAVAAVGAAAAFPRLAAGSECGASGGAVRKAPELPLSVEQQSLPFPTVVCCHDLLLSV